MKNKIIREVVILLSHGSREVQAKRALALLKKKFSKYFSSAIYIEYAFIQFNRPDLIALFKKLSVRLDLKQIKRVVIIPVFLLSGKHTRTDLPLLVKKIKKIYGNLNIKVALPLGPDDYIVKLLYKRYKGIKA